MAARRLDPDEAALWARIAATVAPLEGRISTPVAETTGGPLRRASVRAEAAAVPRPAARHPKPAPAPANTLDGGWHRRLRRGAIAPDRAIDLHGHTLASAHASLERALAEAVADEVRVLLVVTGKPPRGSEARRGLIRASIGDWLAQSAQAARIAAVRVAHPRHGGAGALYLILRRRRGD